MNFIDSPTSFGAYCAIFREKLLVCSKLLLHYLVADIKLYYTRDYNFIYIYLKKNNIFDST